MLKSRKAANMSKMFNSAKRCSAGADGSTVTSAATNVTGTKDISHYETKSVCGE
jgi:hypothetical protein